MEMKKKIDMLLKYIDCLEEELLRLQDCVSDEDRKSIENLLLISEDIKNDF